MILDTNGLSAAADGDPALGPLFRDAEEIVLPSIVLGEFLFGIRQSRHRSRYELWLERALAAYRLLPVDARTAECYADLRDELRSTGRPIPTNDLWIAALALQHSLPLLSRDRHFDLVPGLTRVEW